MHRKISIIKLPKYANLSKKSIFKRVETKIASLNWTTVMKVNKGQRHQGKTLLRNHLIFRRMKHKLQTHTINHNTIIIKGIINYKRRARRHFNLLIIQDILHILTLRCITQCPKCLLIITPLFLKHHTSRCKLTILLNIPTQK